MRYITIAIILNSVMVDRVLITRELNDNVCENTRYSLVSTDAMYAFTAVIRSDDEGRRNNHAGFASRSAPHGFEYQNGTTGGSPFQTIRMPMMLMMQSTMLAYVARAIILFFESMLHDSRIRISVLLMVVKNFIVVIFLRFLLMGVHTKWNMCHQHEQ
jgi:hypothetical protein